jgi:formate dehydrogenase iron-sulfur subunit
MSVGLLIDTTRCIGCNACAEACKEANDLPREVEPKLTARTWSIVENRNDVYVRRMCMHCEDPACASVCPVGALYKSEEGPVAYDESRCIGCRYCMVACPFGVPKYEWDSPLPRVRKCIGCLGRVRDGKQPACAEVCPTGATLFGEREVLLADARQRLQANPKDYVQHIYGEREVGGTHVLFLAGVPFAQLGFPGTLPETEMPSLTWQALSKIPNVVTVGGVSLLGIWWIIHRRMTLERVAGESESAAEADHVEAEDCHETGGRS